MGIRTNALPSLTTLVRITLLLFLAPDPSAFAQAFQPSQILINPYSYDGKRMTVSGTVRYVLPQTTPQGKDYTTFNLCNEDACITAFVWGHLKLLEGQRQSVSGRFENAKHVGPSTFANVLEAQQGSIR